MTDTAPGLETGRKSKTYYNTGTRLSPVWVLITEISAENFNPGDQAVIQAKTRDHGRQIQDEDDVAPASLTFTRLVKKGVTDAVYTALLASYGYGGTVYEWAVMDDLITNSGAKGFRFWGKVTKLPKKRDSGAFVEQSFEVQEISHFSAAGVLEELAALAGGAAGTTAAPTTTTGE